jgi:hypothetical protein
VLTITAEQVPWLVALLTLLIPILHLPQFPSPRALLQVVKTQRIHDSG